MEGDLSIVISFLANCISIHALRMEGDAQSDQCVQGLPYFYPRPPHGGRQEGNAYKNQSGKISIHALRMEGDRIRDDDLGAVLISIHALRMEGDEPAGDGGLDEQIFLSTPSAWRATGFVCRAFGAPMDFYPRPPHGGRH